MERLERSRSQLETFRRLYPQLTTRYVPPSENLDLSHVIWKSTASTPGKQSLPAPQLVVASAIEALLHSRWKNITRVVDGEADNYCAKACKLSSAAILSSDSDLTLYDLGEDGVLIQLHTIEKIAPTKNAASSISAQALRPKRIAKRLKIQSLLRFGFERSKDSTVSNAIILQRTKEAERTETKRNEFDTFSMQYLPAESERVGNLNGLDPKIAELITSLDQQSDQNLEFYLPPLLEDPSRDGAWSYGIDIRRIGYSILQQHVFRGRSSRPVVEHVRRGARIVAVQTQTVTKGSLDPMVTGFLENLAVFLRPHNRTPSSEPILPWWLFSLYTVCAQKISNGKSMPKSQILHLFNTRIAGPLSWDDVHLTANIHAVLYSLRILQQIIMFLTKKCGYKVDGLTSTIAQALASLPSIESLFLDVEHFRIALSKVPVTHFQHDIDLIMELLQPSAAMDSAGIDHFVGALHADSWQMSKTSQRRKSTKDTEGNAKNDSTQNVPLTKNPNSFAALVMDSNSGIESDSDSYEN